MSKIIRTPLKSRNGWRDFDTIRGRSAICRSHLQDIFGDLDTSIVIEFSMEPFDGAKELKFNYFANGNPVCGKLFYICEKSGYDVSLYCHTEELLESMFKKANVDMTKPISLFVRLVLGEESK